MNNNENNNPQMKIMNELNIANNNVVNNQDSFVILQEKKSQLAEM